MAGGWAVADVGGWVVASRGWVVADVGGWAVAGFVEASLRESVVAG